MGTRMRKFTCEHCEKRVEIGTHFICKGLVVSRVDVDDRDALAKS